MLNKKLMIFAIFLVSLFAVSAVSGADNATWDVVSTEQNQVINQTENDLISDGEGTFTELNETIFSAAEGATITLDKDYVYDDGFDEMGIEFTKAITVDGNGHSIDAKSKAAIFYSSGLSFGTPPNYTVVLKNIKFVNGHYSSGSAAIYDWWGANFDISSCSFINFTAPDINNAPAIFIEGATVHLNSCTFEKCPAGAIWILNTAKDSSITSCNFTDCESTYGGAVRVSNHENLNIKSCNFKNCSSESHGGAVYIEECKNCAINSCDFTNCSSKEEGGAICVSNSDFADCVVRSCNFLNCHYKENITSQEAIYSCYKDTVAAVGCTFKDVFPVKIYASNLKMSYTSGSLFKVTVHATDGKPVTETSVVVKVNGKKVAEIKTDANGVVKYKPTQAPGTYKISAEVMEKTVTKTLTVKHILSLKSVAVKKSAKKLVLTATLAKISNKYLKNKVVTFKFNSKTYKAKTDKKGVAKVTIKSSVLKKLKVGKKVTYQATYLKDTAKNTVKVKK